MLVLAGIGVGQLLLFLAGIRQPTRWLFAILMLVAYPIGFVLSHVLIALIYYVVITPIALVFRAMGRDVLGKKLDPSAKTYWRDRGAPRPVISKTRTPRTSSASASSERWQRHGTASAHMTAVRCRRASAISRSTCGMNSSDCM